MHEVCSWNGKVSKRVVRMQAARGVERLSVWADATGAARAAVSRASLALTVTEPKK